MTLHAANPLRVDESFWLRDEVTQALHARDIGALFRLLKKYVGASQTQIGMAVGLEQGYVSKLVNQRRRVTSIDVLNRIAVGLDMPDNCRAMLGLQPRANLWLPDIARVVTAHDTDTQDRQEPQLFGLVHSNRSEWPTWFGVRLARLFSMIDSWRGPNAQSDALQALLHQEILMFDVIAQDGHDPVHVVSRRQALLTLAALPLSFARPDTIALGRGSAIESFLSRCAASVTACWHLLRGSDLYTVDQMLSTYLLQLEGIAKRRSAYQEDAARLASQAHRICGIVALHRSQLRMREHHCKQAFQYAKAASDIGGQASALVSLASTYFYCTEPVRAAVVYERALRLEPSLSPLQRSRIHAELSVVYGQLGREGDALRSSELADRLYPAQPEYDPSYLYAEFTRASLALTGTSAHRAG